MELVAAPQLSPPAGLFTCAAVLEYEGAGRSLIAGLKYHNDRRLLAWMVGAMAERMPVEVEVVTWVPTTRARRRRRGFDQAELLARRLAELTGRPALPTLTRLSPLPQTGRSRADRLALAPRFSCTISGLGPADLALIDDVLTTGATIGSAAHCLLSADSDLRIHGLVAARTR